MKSPFKFLDSYTLRDRKVFFGRDAEVAALYDMVFKTPLTLVYGLSGTGKTSIIQCGLASMFDGPDWLPFYIRKGQNINASLQVSLHKILKDSSIQELPAIITALYYRYYRPVFLIFDQFEELYILGNEDEQATFAKNLRKLIDTKLPCRVILVIREEYLGRLYPLEKEIPSLFDFRLRIEPMNTARVEDVLQNSFDKFNISMEAPEEELKKAIIDNVSGGKSGIQLPYLQIYLDLLYREDYRRDYGDKDRGDELPPLTFTHQEIKRFGTIEKVLDTFLREQTQAIQKDLKARYPKLPSETIMNVLDAFATDDGTKRPIFLFQEEGHFHPEKDFQPYFPELSPEILTACLSALEKSRILRITETSAELAHDSLAMLVEQQRSDEQRHLIEVRSRVENAYNEKVKSNVDLTERQLLSMEDALPKIKLNADLKKFIEDSKKTIERKKRLRKLELQEAREQAEKEHRLRKEAEHARNETEYQRLQALKAKEEAEQQRKEALHAQEEAVQLRRKAEAARAEAENQRAEAYKAQREAEMQREKERKANKLKQIAYIISILVFILSLSAFVIYYRFVTVDQLLRNIAAEHVRNIMIQGEKEKVDIKILESEGDVLAIPYPDIAIQKYQSALDIISNSPIKDSLLLESKRLNNKIESIKK